MTNFAYFPNCLPSFSTNIRDVNNADYGGLWFKDAYTKYFYIKSASTDNYGTNNTCITDTYNSTYIRSTYISGSSIVENSETQWKYF